MINKIEFHEWLRERRLLGYSFRFIKGVAFVDKGIAERINTACQCIETGEEIKLIWHEENTRH